MEANGTYVGLIAVAQVLLLVISMGLEASLNKHIPQIEDPWKIQKTRFLLRRILLVRLGAFVVIGAVLTQFAIWFRGVLPGAVMEYLFWVLLYAGSRSLVPLLGMVLVAQFNTPLTSKINGAVRLIELLAVAVMMGQGLAITALLGLFAATGVLHTILYILFARKNLLGSASPMRVMSVLVFGWVFWINNFGDYFLGRHGDLLFLTALLPDSSAASLYDVAYSLSQIAFLSVTVGFTGVSFANFARLASERRPAMNDFYLTMVRVISLLSIPMYAYLLFNGEGIVEIIYSAEYRTAGQIVTVMVAFRIGSRLFAGGENAEFLLSLGKVGALVGIGALAAALNCGLNLLLIPLYKGTGAAIATGVAMLLANYLGWWLVRRNSGPGVQVQYWLKIITIACLSAWGTSLVLEVEGVATLLMSGFVFLGVFLGVCAIVKPLEPNDLQTLGIKGGRQEKILRFLVRKN